MLHATSYPAITKARHRVLLLHAFPLSSKMWEQMAAAFADLRDDTELIAIDFPGFGLSLPEENWTMPQLVRDLHGFARNGKVIVAGLSMGGYAALEFYRQFPEAVAGLVLSNTRAAADTEVAKRAREIFAKDALKRGADAAIERLYPGFVTEATDPDIAVQIREWMSEARGESIAGALRAMAARNDSTDLLPLCLVPSLVISSDRDTVIPPEEMRDMAMQLRDSTFVEFHGAAHLTAVERPREWAEALASFIDRLT